MAKQNQKKRGKPLRILLSVVVSLIVLAVLSGALLLEPRVHLPAFASLDVNRLTDAKKTLTVLDVNGMPVSDPIYDGNRLYIPLSTLPEYVPKAFVAIEDRRFYSHGGVDYLRILSAARNNMKAGGYSEGGSTISQQLIKNTHLKNEKTMKRKIQEARIAKELERIYSKDEILEMYLNILYFGKNIYGIGAASQYFFDKPAKELTLEEGALLAAVINNPGKFDPYHHEQDALTRRNLVLKRMADQAFIEPDIYEKAAAMPIILSKNPEFSNQFINHAIAEAASLLGKYPYQLFNGSYTIETYYDAGMQAFVDTLLHESAAGLDGDMQILVLNNRTGAYFACGGNSLNDFSGIKRQPGSAIKPFVSYAPALEDKHIYPSSPILDERVDFNGYSPSNYQDKFYGWTDVETSLSHSMNIPAVKLTETAGILRSKTVAERFGIPFHKSDTSLAIALGGFTEGISLPQLLSAYGTLANGGIYIRGGFVRAIYDGKGNAVYQRTEQRRQAVKANTAYLLTDMLQTCAKSGTARRAKPANIPLAAKTGTVGTENGNSDAYCIGYTPLYSAAVWVGNREALLPNEISGGGLPAKTVKRLMEQLNDRSTFEIPDTIVYRDIDLNALKNDHKVVLANDSTPARYRKTVMFSEENCPTAYAAPNTFIERESELDNFNLFKIVDSF